MWPTCILTTSFGESMVFTEFRFAILSTPWQLLHTIPQNDYRAKIHCPTVSAKGIETQESAVTIPTFREAISGCTSYTSANITHIDALGRDDIIKHSVANSAGKFTNFATTATKSGHIKRRTAER